MRWRAPEVFRNLDGPVTGFQVLGERSSGTNYLTQLILANFTGLEVRRLYGWKHGFIDRRVAAEPGFLTVLVTRHPLRWLQSVHARPLDLSASMSGLSFSRFIRHEWQGAFANPGGEEPSTADMVPHVGGNYANPLALRNAKLGYLREMSDMPARLAILRFEDANQAPRRTIDALASGFDLNTGPFAPVHGFKGKGRVRYAPKQMPPISTWDLDFISAELDLAQEAAFGYQLDDIPHFDGLPPWDRRSLLSLLRSARS